MKKIIFAAIAALLLTSCGVGSYSTTSGRADQAYISLTSAKPTTTVNVLVDGTSYQLKCVEYKAFKTKRNIRKTAENTITIAPGKHDVKVMSTKGQELYSKSLYISSNEHRYIEL